MSEQKNNQILDEQRKARQEFLELKKIQHGEMEAPPKPSEVAILPKTRKEKMDNFWFQYKWYVLSAIAIVIVLSVLITQCAKRVNYDMEIVYFGYTAVLDDQTNAIADYISKYADDINGDGEVNVQVINCSYSKSSNNSQYEYTMLSKVQALIAGDKEALLFITDGESYKYFTQLSSETSMFEGEPYKFNQAFYDSTKLDKYGELPEGLQISCRTVNDTTLEKQKGIKEIYDEAKSILNAIKQ